MDQSEGWAGLCAFCKRSQYDLLQAHDGERWGAAWTFVANDVHAAEKAGQQMRRMGTTRLRHITRARLRLHGQKWQWVVIVTEMPGRVQTVLDLETALRVQYARILMDAPICALETSSGLV